VILGVNLPINRTGAPPLVTDQFPWIGSGGQRSPELDRERLEFAQRILRERLGNGGANAVIGLEGSRCANLSHDRISEMKSNLAKHPQ
jgi:hypothetical protein